MTKPPDYKAEAREWLRQRFHFGKPDAAILGVDIDSLAALLERLCGEALERAKEIAAEIMYIVEHRRWNHENSAADFEKRLKQCHEKAEAIRALADQPEAEGKK